MKLARTIVLQLLVSVAVLVALVIAANGCKDNPVDPEEEHADAEGLVLTMNSVDIVTVTPSGDTVLVTGMITVQNGTETDHIAIYFLDHDGDEFQPDDPDFSLGWSIADTSVAGVIHEEEEWEMHIEGKQVGSTTIEIQLLHAGHVDYRTPNIPIQVTQ